MNDLLQNIEWRQSQHRVKSHEYLTSLAKVPSLQCSSKGNNLGLNKCSGVVSLVTGSYLLPQQESYSQEPSL